MKTATLHRLRPAATFAPLPSWRSLALALLRPARPDHELAEPWVRAGEQAWWVERSAHSLRLIAEARKSVRGDPGPVRCWVPDYFCESALGPLRETGADMTFYPVTNDLQPDFTACRALARSGKRPEIFLLVHYFGKPGPAREAASFCRLYDGWLVEDAVHVFLPVRGVGAVGDFVLYSPHKHLALPDGALLIARPATEPTARLQPQVKQVIDAQLARWIAAERGRRTRVASWVGKRVLQKCGLRGRREEEADFSADQVPAPALRGGAMSPTARRLLSTMIGGLRTVERIRRRNGLVWTRVLDGLAPPANYTPEDGCGYFATFVTQTPETARALWHQLRQAGIPACAWPDLPPEVSVAKAHERARWLRLTRVHVHVHQTLDLQKIARSLQKEGSDAQRVEWRWFRGSDEEWERLFRSAFRPNLLQSTAYGRAKSGYRGRASPRAVLFAEGEVVALAQAQRRRPGIWRVNRGPLFLRPPTAEMADACLREMGRVFRGRLLSIAPDLEGRPDYWLSLARRGYRGMTKASPWTTVWLDLQPEESDLRASLAHKWRNALAFAERAGLQFESNQTAEAFSWLLTRHVDAMQEKGFQGTPTEVVRSLHADGQFVVFRAVNATGAVGGVGIALHPPAATYLLGWNGTPGRELKANQFLLWNTALWLRRNGFRWFDLGGIDEVRLPGVAEFKLGMGGTRVELAGEYLKI